MLEEGQQDDWFNSTLITVMTAVSAVVIAAFVIRELTCEVSAVNIRLFKDPVFLSGTLIGSLMFALLMATMFLLPLFMQTLLGFTATDAGLALMPHVLAMMIAVPIVGRIYNAVSPRIVIGVGVLFIAWAAYLMSHFTLQMSQTGIILALTTQGIGFSRLFVPLSTVALSAIPRHLIADATGLNSLFRQVGGSIGLAVAAILLSRYGVQARTALVSHVTGMDPAAMDRLRQTAGGFMSRGFDPSTARNLAMRVVDGAIALQSQLLAFERSSCSPASCSSSSCLSSSS